MFKNHFKTNFGYVQLHKLKSAIVILAMTLLPGALTAQTVENGVLTSWTGATGEITIPQTVKKIAAKVFQNNTKITAVTFNDGLEEIGDEAFMSCSKLTKLSF